MKITFQFERVFGFGVVFEWESFYSPRLVGVVGPLVVTIERSYA